MNKVQKITLVIPGFFDPLAQDMEVVEVKMSLPRWDSWRKQLPQISDQSVGGHSLAMARIVSIMAHRLRPYVNLDELRLKRAYEAHDMGEALLQRDVRFVSKRDLHDVEEYQAWLQHIECFRPFGDELVRQMQEDFLLQFCLTHSNKPGFDDQARETMRHLRENFFHEAVAFRVLEFMEYLFFPTRQYRDRDGCEAIFIDVVDRQLPALEHWGAQLPGFIEHFWTRELSDWYRAERAKLNGHVV